MLKVKEDMVKWYKITFYQKQSILIEYKYELPFFLKKRQ